MKADNLILQAKWHPYLLAAVVLFSRLPFLFDGHGHEEDSYGLVVNAWEMHSTGHYVASRFPGHPFQEYIYLLIWNQPAWIWNFLSTLFSITGVLAFHHALKRIGVNHAMEASLMLAFTPMFFTAGTYTIDYTWSLAFVMLSFSSLVCRKFVWCGILLGLAVGCRITSGVFIIPWMMLLWQRLDFDQWKNYVLKVGIPFTVIGVLWYVPAYMQYGTGFFDYSDQFPYPPFTKIIYKATIGVFGILGILALIVAFTRWVTQKQKQAVNPPQLFTPQRLVYVIAVIIVFHILSYLRLPQKAGYMLPIVPFVILLVLMYTPKHVLRIVTMMFLLSPFILGMNITDDLRGSGATGASIKFNVSGQEISIDAARGPAFAEQEKRRNKMEYVNKVCNYLDTTTQSQVLICGWWYNEILVQHTISKYFPNNNGKPKRVIIRLPGEIETETQLVFYESCADLTNRKPETDNGELKIYFLPEQDLYNDQMFGQSCTNKIAEPFPLKNP